MKNVYFCILALTILIRPNNAQADDYSDLDAFCQEALAVGQKVIQNEVTKGHLTEKEAKNDIQAMPNNQQCVCHFQQLLEGAGAALTLRIQKSWLGIYTVSELVKMAEQGLFTLPDNQNDEEFYERIAKACEMN